MYTSTQINTHAYTVIPYLLDYGPMVQWSACQFFTAAIRVGIPAIAVKFDIAYLY